MCPVLPAEVSKGVLYVRLADFDIFLSIDKSMDKPVQAMPSFNLEARQRNTSNIIT